ncbi:MAG: hypothetical protein ACRCUY_06365 [Thermoguttaceae bacterium]
MKTIFNFFARIKGMWQLSGIALKVTNYAATWPGLDDGEKIRAWLRPALLDLSVLAALTETVIDDKIAWAALRIVDSEKSWTAIYSLIVIASDSRGYLITGDDSVASEDVLASTITILDDIDTENPALIIAAIGLLIQILQLFKSKRAD